MNFYIIYDNLYEEFQMPFCIKNDTVAKEEFIQFKRGLMDQAKNEKEKQKINSRFYLYKIENLSFDRESARVELKINREDYQGIEYAKAEPIEWGNEGDDINE